MTLLPLTISIPLFKCRLKRHNHKMIHDIHPDLRLKHSKRARRVALRLDSKQRIMNLVVPTHMPIERAYRFAKQHEDWIAQTLSDLPAPINFQHGAVIPILGTNRTICVHHQPDRKTTSVILQKHSLDVSTNKNDPSQRIERFLKKFAKDEITRRAHDKAALIDKTPKSVSVRDTKSRWGSCGADGDLSFSWRLIFAPLESLDYVVAHEVAHMIHLNHGKAFWSLCRELSDNYLDGEYWMRNHGQELMRFGQN